MKAKYSTILFYSLIIFIHVLLLNSCKKFVHIPDPNDQLNSDLVFSDSSSATSAITGIYGDMLTNRNLFSNSSVTLFTGMSADELYFYSPGSKDEFVKNQITQTNHINIDNSFWKPAYQYIYAANLAIEKIEESKNLSVSLKNRLTGEAKFVRAFCYFHLVNLFGDVPLITSSKYQTAATIARTGVADVYSQIINDLKEAKSVLPVQYPTSERIRPNKWTVVAMLSRCYLYTGRWSDAESEATSIISSGLYSLESNLNNIFLKGSTEAIWQLKPVRAGFNTYEGLEILPTSAFTAPTYLVTTSLRNSFENLDNRKNAWITKRFYNNDTLYYPFKYKLANGATLTEYYIVFRLSEQYLIRAEANLNLNKIPESQSDLNKIRNRAGLANTVANTAASLKLAIEQERQAELFCEWGNRWYDLKRTGRANIILAPFKGATWQTTDILWPVPQQELLLNPTLIQNPGY